MMKVFLFLIFFGTLVFSNLDTSAEVRLPSILGNHMVLQQKSEVNLWGWCSPAEMITVKSSWDTTKYVTKGTSGAKWSLKIKTPSAGGPYTITINNKIVLKDASLKLNPADWWPITPGANYMATSKDLNEFYIAGSDQKFLFANARIEGNTVVVWNKAVKEPVAVRFGFSNTIIPNLFNKEGMPVNLFRTDQWEVKTDAVVK